MRNFAEDRELVDNKAKGPISKRVFQENKARQNKHFLPRHANVRSVSGDKKCSFFGKFDALCFL